MKDFQKLPQYDYCSDVWQVTDIQIESEQDTIDSTPISNADFIKPNVLIAYGSETGTAEAAACSLARRMKICKPRVHTLNEMSRLEVTTLAKFSHILIICSTFGAGEPPQNAKEFFNCDLERVIKSLNTSFAVLALGSSLYPDFCKAGIMIHEYMMKFGAKPIMDVACADASKGSQSEIIRWSTSITKLILPASVRNQMRLENQTYEDKDQPKSSLLRWHTAEDAKDSLNITDNSDGTWNCIANTELFMYENNRRRSTIHVELESFDEDITYETGDHFSVMPMNSDSMVQRFCSCFTYELEKAASSTGMNVTQIIQQPFSIEGQANDLFSNKSLYELLRRHLDISFNSISYFIDFLSILSSRLDNSVPERVSKYFKGMVKDIVRRYNDLDDDIHAQKIRERFPTIVHLLEKTKHVFCVPLEKGREPLVSLTDVLILMPRLQARQYSIASSAVDSSRKKVSIIVGLVNIDTEAGILIEGVCSHYLHNLSPGQNVNAKVVKSYFRLPPYNNVPIIMIATGTGLSPFMAFLSERADEIQRTGDKLGICHLFFGCRNKEEFLFRDKILDWEAKGVLKLHLAYSRSNDKPQRYVQDSLEENGKELANLIIAGEGTHVYICGNAHIAKLCSEVCTSLLQKHGDMSKMAAMRLIAEMYQTNHWQLDVWGDSKAIVEDSITDIAKNKQLKKLASKRSSLIDS